MADKKLTELSELTTPAVGDKQYIVDISDTTDDSSGSSKYLTLQRLSDFFESLILTASKIKTALGVSILSGDNTGDQTLPVKATGAEVITGTDDAKFVTAKAILDSNYITLADIPASAAFWTAFTGAYASAVTFTVATDLTAIFKKGVSVKWLSSADALKVGKVVSSSYSAPDTTVTVVGSAVEAGDKTFKYGTDCLSETFIVAGNQSTGTNVSKTWTAKTDIYPISVDAVNSTAGVTGTTDYDVNDDGTTIIATKPAIASTATTDLDNVVSAPTTAIAVNSLVTVDIDAASTTQAIDGYITLYYFPTWWVSRT